jgi:hypothetical protein
MCYGVLWVHLQAAILQWPVQAISQPTTLQQTRVPGAGQHKHTTAATAAAAAEVKGSIDPVCELLHLQAGQPAGHGCQECEQVMTHLLRLLPEPAPYGCNEAGATQLVCDAAISIGLQHSTARCFFSQNTDWHTRTFAQCSIQLQRLSVHTCWIALTPFAIPPTASAALHGGCCRQC